MNAAERPDAAPEGAGPRRLVAIVHADIAGYSQHIGRDDAGTLDRVRMIRRDLVDPEVLRRGGRLVNTAGDALLLEFTSITSAVQFAAEVQRRMPEFDGGLPPGQRIRFRVGINIGDVLPEGTDIHGDGVNVAARLQAEAPVGGICVSRSVRDHVGQQLNLAFEELGTLQLKNIAQPVHIYRVRPSGASMPRQGLALPDKPSIAVLPFQNFSGDPEQEHFADGIVEDVTIELSRIPWLFVIARNSSFTYKGRAVDVRQVARELGINFLISEEANPNGDAKVWLFLPPGSWGNS